MPSVRYVFVSWKKPTQQTRNFPLFPEAASEGDDIAAIPAETASVLNVLRSMSRLVLPESSRKAEGILADIPQVACRVT
jgi:hypothetical protein